MGGRTRDRRPPPGYGGISWWIYGSPEEIFRIIPCQGRKWCQLLGRPRGRRSHRFFVVTWSKMSKAWAGDRIPLYILAFLGTFYAYNYYLANDWAWGWPERRIWQSTAPHREKSWHAPTSGYRIRFDEFSMIYLHTICLPSLSKPRIPWNSMNIRWSFLGIMVARQAFNVGRPCRIQPKWETWIHIPLAYRRGSTVEHPLQMNRFPTSS